MKTKIDEDRLCYDLQNAVDGIQRIDEDIESKQMLLTFFDRTDFLRMSQFLKMVKAIMLEFYEKNLPAQTRTFA